MIKKDISVIIGDTKFNYRVGAIMQYKDKIIIEKGKKASHGVIPGGRVMTGEDTKMALIREIQEEMHFDISNKDIQLCHIIENFFYMKKRKHHELYFVYKITLDDNDDIVHKRAGQFINYDSDGNWYEYIPIDKLNSENIKPNVLKNIIKKQEMGISIQRDI